MSLDFTDYKALSETLRAEVERLRAERCPGCGETPVAWFDQLKARAEKAEREINDAWLMIEYGWADNIESRDEWERRYRKNFDDGGSGPLGMAIHAAGYKRETKAEARAEKLAAALRDVADHLLRMKDGAHNCAMCGNLYREIARALADGEGKK